MTRARKLVLGRDGTWNEPGEPTNVVKFLAAVANPGGQRQDVHYEEGVGARAWEALPGGIYGCGLSKRIRSGHRFLRRMYANEDWQKDEHKLFLIGFSRGAYTVRRLAELIAHSGLPK